MVAPRMIQKKISSEKKTFFRQIVRKELRMVKTEQKLRKQHFLNKTETKVNCKTLSQIKVRILQYN